MTMLVERDLEFDFAGAERAEKFDVAEIHASSSIQTVDFIVEYADCYQFIEIKDPDEPGAADVQAFKDKLKSGQLIKSLAGKYRDSLFFHRFLDHDEKNVEYIVLLSMKELDDAQLLSKLDELHRSIPYAHPLWQRNSAAVCVILNVAQWKKRFGPASIRRLSDTKPTGIAGVPPVPAGEAT